MHVFVVSLANVENVCVARLFGSITQHDCMETIAGEPRASACRALHAYTCNPIKLFILNLIHLSVYILLNADSKAISNRCARFHSLYIRFCSFSISVFCVVVADQNQPRCGYSTRRFRSI